jgi:hypothetical protein
VDQDYIDLCRDEMNAIAEASQILVTEIFMPPVDMNGHCVKCPPCIGHHGHDSHCPNHKWTPEQQDRRRAELYKQYLDAAGIEIRRKG